MYLTETHTHTHTHTPTDGCCGSYHEEAVVLRFRPQVLEDDLLHELLHEIPVFHHPMPDGPLDVVTGG